MDQYTIKICGHNCDTQELYHILQAGIRKSDLSLTLESSNCLKGCNAGKRVNVYCGDNETPVARYGEKEKYYGGGRKEIFCQELGDSPLETILGDYRAMLAPKKIKKILLVEDNANYASSAENYFASRGQSTILARDYAQAIEKLCDPDLVGVISDCFFPEQTGSGKIALGIELVEKMAKLNSREKRMNEGLGILSPYVDLEDQDLKKYAQCYINSIPPFKEVSLDSLVRMVVRLAANVDTEKLTASTKKILKLVYRENQVPKDYYGALIDAMGTSEDNQPLGLLVAEKSRELGLPLVLVTSTYHHDILTEPVNHFASGNRWNLIDCGFNRNYDKSTPQFWERAFRELEKQLK